jgi:hypothetical protein
MKKLVVILGAAVLSLMLVQSAFAQTAQQTVTLAVNPIHKISVSGPVSLTIETGTAGEDALASVTDASTTYNEMQNVGNAGKITAQLGGALASGYTLELTMASTKGTSAGAVDISDGNAKDVVTAINRGADANQTITYMFSALASAGTMTSTAKTVTFTVTE